MSWATRAGKKSEAAISTSTETSNSGEIRRKKGAWKGARRNYCRCNGARALSPSVRWPNSWDLFSQRSELYAKLSGLSMNHPNWISPHLLAPFSRCTRSKWIIVLLCRRTAIHSFGSLYSSNSISRARVESDQKTECDFSLSPRPSIFQILQQQFGNNFNRENGRK